MTNNREIAEFCFPKVSYFKVISKNFISFFSEIFLSRLVSSLYPRVGLIISPMKSEMNFQFESEGLAKTNIEPGKSTYH